MWLRRLKLKYLDFNNSWDCEKRTWIIRFMLSGVQRQETFIILAHCSATQDECNDFGVLKFLEETMFV